MTSARTLLWIERLVWILIYGGLFALILGLATMSRDAAIAWSLAVTGACVAAVGLVLVYVRSRLKADS